MGNARLLPPPDVEGYSVRHPRGAVHSVLIPVPFTLEIEISSYSNSKPWSRWASERSLKGDPPERSSLNLCRDYSLLLIWLYGWRDGDIGKPSGKRYISISHTSHSRRPRRLCLIPVTQWFLPFQAISRKRKEYPISEWKDLLRDLRVRKVK